jgi:hypothetical protein
MFDKVQTTSLTAVVSKIFFCLEMKRGAINDTLPSRFLILIGFFAIQVFFFQHRSLLVVVFFSSLLPLKTSIFKCGSHNKEYYFFSWMKNTRWKRFSVSINNREFWSIFHFWIDLLMSLMIMISSISGWVNSTWLLTFKTYLHIQDDVMMKATNNYYFLNFFTRIE